MAIISSAASAPSISRRRQRFGKRMKARQLVIEGYGGFTKGFDSAGLQEAGALFEE
jgi:hypothetical protein